MKKEEIDAEIFKYEPNIKKHSDEHWAYRVLLSAIHLGPFASKKDFHERMSNYWGNWTGRVHRMCNRASRNSIILVGRDQFLDSEIYGDGLGLALGCNCLMGHIKRTKAKTKEDTQSKFLQENGMI